MCIKDLYSNDEFPFLHILGYLQLITGNRDWTKIFKYAYEHVTSSIGVEIFYLTIYIALECIMSSSQFHNETK